MAERTCRHLCIEEEAPTQDLIRGFSAGGRRSRGLLLQRGQLRRCRGRAGADGAMKTLLLMGDEVFLDGIPAGNATCTDSHPEK